MVWCAPAPARAGLRVPGSPGPGGAARTGSQPITITVGAGGAGPVVGGDFAGLSFERAPLDPGHAGVAGYLFSPANTSLVALFRRLGLGNLRVGGGTVDQVIPAGTGGDGFAGIDNLFGFAAAAGVTVTYTLRMLSPVARPVHSLESVNAGVAGYIWGRYRRLVSSFAIGNEPDWHAFHSHPGHRFDPAIYEEVPGVPGSAYRSYLARWRSLAEAVRAAAPGAPLSGPDTGAYTRLTYIPGPDTGVSWTERFAGDERNSGRIAEITQHHYVGADPGTTTARQAIANMLSPEWVTATTPGTQPAATAYTPCPWLWAHNLAPVAAAGLRYRMTEANDYLTGVPGASNAFASALWALDYLHWWASHGAAGVNFHNKQWLVTDTIVPDPAVPGGYAATPKGYAIKAFALACAGRVRPAQIHNPAGINVTAYCIGGTAEDHVTIINKTHGAGATAAAVTIVPPRPGTQAAQVMTLTSGQPGDAAAASATLGGAPITADTPWGGQWQTLPARPGPGISLTVPAATATIVKILARG